MEEDVFLKKEIHRLTDQIQDNNLLDLIYKILISSGVDSPYIDGIM